MAAANPLILPKRLADAYFTAGSPTFKMLLVSSLPSESDLDTFDFRSDVANEVAASGTYALGGAAVTCTVGAVDATNNRVPVTFGAPAAFTSATISAVGGWVYKVGGSAAIDELVTFVDFGGPITSTVNTFTVTMGSPMYINR